MLPIQIIITIIVISIIINIMIIVITRSRPGRMITLTFVRAIFRGN